MRKAFGEKGLDRLLALRTAQQEKTYRAKIDTKPTLKGKLEALAKLRSVEGYMAEVRRDPETGGWLFVENHCPICAAARICQALCREELALLHRVLGKNVRVPAHAKTKGLELVPAATPVIFWDLFGKEGHPVRATISEMGPLLIGRMLDLNEVQEGVPNIVFHVADQEGLLLLDLKDLQAALKHVADNASDIGTQYRNVAPATIGAIQRALLSLQLQGGDNFFGEPALQLSDIMRVDASGKGYVSVLA